MTSLNKVFLAGNLTSDPEVRYANDGKPVCYFNMAINNVYKNPQSKTIQDVTYVSVTVWGNQAQPCVDNLKKGSSILLEGRLKLDTWKSKQGEKRSKLKVISNRVQFLFQEKPPEPVIPQPQVTPMQYGAFPFEDDHIPF